MDESTVGGTPPVELPLDVPPTVYAKLEWFNGYERPYGGGSVETRIGQSMLDRAETEGAIDGDATIVEPSSGNTGTALARLGRERGYDVEVLLPPAPSEAKVLAIEDAGGTTTRSRTYERMIEDCTERAAAAPERYQMLDQYANPANPDVHEAETGRVVWEATDGRVTHFVAGVGTGGTVTGGRSGTAATRRSSATNRPVRPRPSPACTTPGDRRSPIRRCSIPTCSTPGGP